MRSGDVIRAPRSQAGRGGSQGRGRRNSTQRRRYDLMMWTRSYVLGLFWLCLSLAICWPLTPIVYITVGWQLSHRVSNNVRWVRAFASLSNVAHAKATFIATWVWSMPRLIFTVWFVRSA
jgi:hypothetical protein